MNKGLSYFLVRSIKLVDRWSVSCCTVRASASVGRYTAQITSVLISRGNHLGLAETQRTSRSWGTSSDMGVAGMFSLMRMHTPPQSLTLLFLVKVGKGTDSW